MESARTRRRLISTIAPLGVLVLLAMVMLTAGAFTAQSAPITHSNTLNRPQDPVVIKASNLPAALNGLGDTSLRLYSYDAMSGIFYPVPYQVDSVDVDGIYVPPDGSIDPNDELVFMADDMLDQVTDPGLISCTIATVNNCLPIGSTIYELQVTDPIGGGDGYLYISTESSCPASSADYISWDPDGQDATGNYTNIGGVARGSFFSVFGGSDTIPAPDQYLGIDALEVNNSGIDILDRMKLRVAACFGLGSFCNIPLNLDEFSAAALIPPVFDVPIDGPVRLAVGGGNEPLTVAAYGSRLDIGLIFDPADLVPPGFNVKVSHLRASFDLNDPTSGSGMSNWYDSNGNSYTVDGAPDPDPALFDWYQVNDDGTYGGWTVAISELNAGTGTADAYYWDDTTNPPPDSADTGDGDSFSDTGIQINNSQASGLNFNLNAYILPVGTNTPVGADYYAWATNPLGDNVVNTYTTRECTTLDVRMANMGQTPSLTLPLTLAGSLTLLAVGTFIVTRARRRQEI